MIKILSITVTVLRYKRQSAILGILNVGNAKNLLSYYASTKELDSWTFEYKPRRNEFIVEELPSVVGEDVVYLGLLRTR
jgi:hypothetical protein